MKAILYAGDELGPANIAKNIPIVAAAGWTHLVLTSLHITKDSLLFNGTPLITSGVAQPALKPWINQLAKLKDASTIKQLYISIGGSSGTDWQVLKSFYHWGYSGTIIETNFNALRAAFDKVLDGLEIDFEDPTLYVGNQLFMSDFAVFIARLPLSVGLSIAGVSGSAEFSFWISLICTIAQVPAAQSTMNINLRSYSGTGCSSAYVWLQQLRAAKISSSLILDDLFSIGMQARYSTDGGKTWNGSCPPDVQAFISNAKQENQASIGGGAIWNLANVLQSGQSAGACATPADLQSYVRAIAQSMGKSPSIKSIMGIDDFRDYASQAEGPNIARVPLAARVPQPADSKPCLLGFDMGEFQYDTFFDAWSQGAFGDSPSRSASNVYNFSYWQFVDIVYYFGHNFVTIPPVVWTNCAHKNGVLCLGTINLDVLYNIDPSLVENFLTQPANPVSGNLYRNEAINLLLGICKTFGFDGFIINYEQVGLRGKPDCVAGMLTILKALNDAGYKSIWYDSPFSSENQHYDNRLTQTAAPFAENASYFQSNYNWGTYNGSTNFPALSYEVVANSFSNPLAERKNVFQGLWCSTLDPQGQTPPYKGNFFPAINCLNSPGPNPPIPNGPPDFYSGICVYYPAWMMYDLRPHPTGSPSDELPSRENFHNNDEAFWNGSKNLYGYPVKDQVNKITDSQCMSYYLKPRTVLNSLGFYSVFNDGEGDFYNVGGKTLSTGSWNNLSDQSVLPTDRFSIIGVDMKNNGTKLDHSNAANVFTGGSSLYVDFGGLPSVQLKLYDTSIAVSSAVNINLTVKASAIEAPELILICGTTPVLPPLTNTLNLGNGWIRYTYSVKPAIIPPSSPLIESIQVKLTSSGGTPSVYIGALSIVSGVPMQPWVGSFAPTDLLDWYSNYKASSSYRVYGVKNSQKYLLGVVYNSCYRLAYTGIPSKNIFNSDVFDFSLYYVQEVNYCGQSSDLP